VKDRLETGKQFSRIVTRMVPGKTDPGEPALTGPCERSIECIMNVLFVTDLHGITWKYDRLLRIAHSFRVQVLIHGGDMLPRDGNPFDQDEFIVRYLDYHFAQFDAAGIYYLCFLGNDDLRIFNGLFDETCNKYPHIVNLAQRKFQVENFEFIGMNWIVDYPFRLKDWCRMDTEDYVFQQQLGSGLLSTPDGWKELDDWPAYARTLPTLKNELSQLVRPANMNQAIYVIHMPPHRLGLDKCANGLEVGSKAVYNFLLESQPILSLHGHIHESPEVSGEWHAMLGRTVCVQPGQLASLTYVTIDLDAMSLNRHLEHYH
jgi:Icc-related predicted phosphoesterase